MWNLGQLITHTRYGKVNDEFYNDVTNVELYILSDSGNSHLSMCSLVIVYVQLDEHVTYV